MPQSNDWHEKFGMLRKNASLLADAALIVLLALLACAIHREVLRAPPSWFPGDIGVAAVPGMLNRALVALAVLLALRLLVSWRKQRNVESPSDEASVLSRSGTLRFSLALTLLLAFVASLGNPLIGFEALSFGYVLLNVLLLLGPGLRHAIVAAAIAGLSVLAVTVVFTRVFAVVLP